MGLNLGHVRRHRSSKLYLNMSFVGVLSRNLDKDRRIFII